MDVLDAIETLEHHAQEPTFAKCWRDFLKSCSLKLVADLPSEVQTWMAAADEFDQERLNSQQLEAMRVRAWQFHDAKRSNATPSSELSAMRAVMFRLFEFDANRFYETADHFVRFCGEAGLSESELTLSLKEQFRKILRKP